MQKRSCLSAKQARFISEYLVDGNGTRAAIAAGYGRAGAHVAASRLLSNVKLRAAIEKRQNADATRLQLERDDVLRGLLEAIVNAKILQDPGAMISGWATIARLMGYNNPEVHRVDVRLDQDAELRRLNRMSDAELEKLIANGSASTTN